MKNIEELLKEMKQDNSNFSDNSWLFIVLLLLFLCFSNSKKEETTSTITINIKEADLYV